jgi:predicted nucleic acid-binding Zn ribbon protein
MPTYSFLNTETGEEFDLMMKISEKAEYLNQNKHLTSVVSAPSIVSGVSTTNRVPSGFKEVLSKVADAHSESVVGDRYRSKSIKEIRTKEIVDKHYNKMKKS